MAREYCLGNHHEWKPRTPYNGSIFGKREIFLIEFQICLYKHLFSLYIRNPLFPIAVFISILWQLKVYMFYPKNSFPIV